jgi:hypothetical protein
MTRPKTSGLRSPVNRAVMEQRSEAVDSLDFFPTPPWATRALFEHLGTDWLDCHAWEPAAGEGHMSEVLAEFFGSVHASDVHDYGRGYAVGSFTGVGADVAAWPGGNAGKHPDWIITNPPFNDAEIFFERAIDECARGVALLLRTNWIATQGRYNKVFSVRPPSRVLQFTDRVPMVKGRWDPNASTATEYAWFVWERQTITMPILDRRFDPPKPFSPFYWIEPGAPLRCSRPDDRARFAAWSLAVEPDPTVLDLFSASEVARDQRR